jgi:methyl-accepting chemotaxis protein
MNSIRWKLLRAALFIIATLSITSFGFFIMHLVVVENYKSISDNMISEYQLMDLTSNLIAAYNTRFRNISIQDSQSEQAILDINAHIDALTTRLDKSIVSKDSVVSYIGLKNTITNVRKEIDTGLAALNSGNVTDVSEHYDTANEKYSFVQDNGAQLILNELKYADSVQQNINTIYQVSAIAAGILLLATSLGCVLYMVSFSQKIVDPVQKLKEFAEQVAGGNMNVKIDETLLTRTDEIGSLSNSYQIMIIKLTDTIAKQTEASTTLASKNSELEQMNKFMVGRELRMQELKTLVAQLTKKLEEHDIH